MIIGLSIASFILFVIAFVLIATASDSNDEKQLPSGFIFLLFGIIFVVIASREAWIGSPMTPWHLHTNEVIQVMSFQQKTNSSEYVAVIKRTDDSILFLTLDKQPPIGWVKVVNSDKLVLTKVLIPFSAKTTDEKPAVEMTPTAPPQ